MSSYYYMCPHTTTCVSSYYYVSLLLVFCPHTTTCVLILLHVSSYYYICVLVLLPLFCRQLIHADLPFLLYMCPHMCPHTTTYVSSYYYIRVLILLPLFYRQLIHAAPHSLLYMCPHTTTTMFCYTCVLRIYHWQHTRLLLCYVYYCRIPHTTTVESLLLYASSYYYDILLYMCLHISVTSHRAPLFCAMYAPAKASALH